MKKMHEEFILVIALLCFANPAVLYADTSSTGTNPALDIQSLEGNFKVREDSILTEIEGVNILRMPSYGFFAIEEPIVFSAPQEFEKKAVYSVKISFRQILARAVPNSVFSSLRESLSKVQSNAANVLPQLEWGIVFLGEDDKRLGAIYLSRDGTSGFVNSTPVTFAEGVGILGLSTKPPLLQWVQKVFPSNLD